MTYRHKFTVKGRGSFPVDMLRYDCCYPADGTSVSRIQDGIEPREITLVRLAGKKDWVPTRGRWESFGWGVAPHSDIQKWG